MLEMRYPYVTNVDSCIYISIPYHAAVCALQESMGVDIGPRVGERGSRIGVLPTMP
jgi:hypothetical protein